jgi:hypothetical protein
MDEFSPNPPALADPVTTLTPVRRPSESATFLSGNLPISCAVTTSETTSLARFESSDAWIEARMPLTTMSLLWSCGSAVVA